MDNREALQRTLTRARRALQILEEEAAGYTALTRPAHLQIELEEQGKEVASLEARLAQLENRRAAAVPNNLSGRPPIFVGRRDEMARCLASLSPDERGWGVTIDGIGGMGKTTLALEVAHAAQARAWFDAYFFVSAKTSWLTPEGERQETLTLTSLDAFVREFARLLGNVEATRMTDATERRSALLDALRGRRALLIWDNLETLTAAERDLIAEFLRRLPGANKAIVTSRRRTGESALTIRLDRLTENEALDLMAGLGAHYPTLGTRLSDAGLPMLRALYEASGGNPLAIHWTLGLVAQKGLTVAQALARLQDAGRSSDLYGFLFADAARDLAPSDKTVLAALSAFQAPAALAALAEATELTPPQISIALERLVTLSLVSEVGDDHYGLHPLTRAYVTASLNVPVLTSAAAPGAATASSPRVALDPAARDKVLRYWVDFARKYGGHSENYKTFERLDAEWANLEGAAASLYNLTGLPGALVDQEAAGMLNRLTRALGNFLWYRGYWEEWVRIATWAYEAMAALGNWSKAGWRAYDVAFIHYSRGETEAASVWAERTSVAMRRSDGWRDQAMAARLQGLVARQRGDLTTAVRLFNEALNAYRELKRPDDEAIALNDLGATALQRKEHDRAEDYYRQALALNEQENRKEDQAYVSGNLGLLALDRNRPAEARAWYTRELALAREVDRQDLIASAQYGLARALEDEGQPRDALPLAEDALRIYERLRDQNLEGARRLAARLQEKAAAGPLQAPSAVA